MSSVGPRLRGRLVHHSLGIHQVTYRIQWLAYGWLAGWLVDENHTNLLVDWLGYTMVLSTYLCIY